jgi:hypothetical protein
MQVNRWVGRNGPGDVGLWNNNKNWSLKKYPRHDEKQVVCIRTAGRVVLDRRAALQVQVAAIELGGTTEGVGNLVVTASNSLFVEAKPTQVASTVESGSRLKLKGAVLGGHGRIEVHGALTLYGAAGRTNVVTTRPCADSCLRPPREHGTIAVLARGVFRINHGPTTVTDSYHVVLGGGRMVMQHDGGEVTADGGTRLAVRQSSRGPEGEVLVFHNDGGWYTGADPLGLGLTRVRIHGGVVLKDQGTGTSSIDGDVVATAPVTADVRTGRLAIAGINPRRITSALSGSAYSTGSCTPPSPGAPCQPTATSDVDQIVTVKLPSGTDADVSVEFKRTDVTNFGEIVKIDQIDADQPDGVTRAHAVRLELQYDAPLVGGRTPATTPVELARNGVFRELPDCGPTGRIPSDSGACVDRRTAFDASRFGADGDLIMVVRTLHFSRYICR